MTIGEYALLKEIRLAPFTEGRKPIFSEPVLCAIGAAHGKSAAQVALRYLTQNGIAVIPKSVHPERIASNARIFDFTIDQEDMDLLDTLNQNYHSSSIPEDLRDIVF